MGNFNCVLQYDEKGGRFPSTIARGEFQQALEDNIKNELFLRGRHT